MSARRNLMLNSPDSKAIQWKYITAATAAVVVMLYYVFIGLQNNNIAASRTVNLVNILLLSCLAAGLVVWEFKEGKKQSFGTLFPALSVFWVAVFLSVLFSENFWQSFDEFFFYGYYLVFGIAAAKLSTKLWIRDLLFKSVLITGAFFLGVKLLSSSIWFLDWMANTEKELTDLLYYRTISPNQTAAFSNLLLMISLVFFSHFNKKGERAALAVVIVMSVLMVFLSASRGGLLGMVGGVVFFLGMIFLRRAEKLKKKWQISRRMLVLIIFLLGISVGLVAYGYVRIGRSGLEVRMTFWQTALDSWKQAPLFGKGLHTFGREISKVWSFPPDPLHSHAHSLYLNILSEAGFTAVAPLLYLGISLGLKGVREMRKSLPDPYQQAAMAALVSLLVHGLVDTLIVIPFLSLMMAIILGSGFPKQNRSGLSTYKRDKIFLMAILGSVLLTGWFSYWQRSAIIKAVDHGNAQEWQSAAYYIEIASTRRPGSALINQQKALIVSHLAEQNSSSRQLDQAVESFQQAVRLDPTWAMNHAQLGRLLAAQGQHEEAVAALSKAVEVAPRAPLIHLNLAVTAEEAGLADLARWEYWSVLSMKRGWSDSNFWQETPLRQRVYYDYQKWSLLDQGRLNSPPGELEQIKGLIEDGNYSQAEEELHRFELIRSIRGGTTLEIMWMKAWLTFQRGDLIGAVTLAERAFDGWRVQSSYGPGNQVGFQYGEKMYRIRGLEEDMTPQFIPAPWLDSWLDRMVIAGSWYQEIGKAARAISIYQEVLQYSPGHPEAEAELGRLTD